jgi:hypothetical protein
MTTPTMLTRAEAKALEGAQTLFPTSKEKG